MDIQATLRKHLVSIVAAVGIGGLGTGAMAGARVWAATEMTERHEGELQEVKLNAYFTCLMVKQLYDSRPIKETKLQLDIDLDCHKPGSK